MLFHNSRSEQRLNNKGFYKTPIFLPISLANPAQKLFQKKTLQYRIHQKGLVTFEHPQITC